MELRDLNGGFPEPPPGDPVRVVRAAHPACGGEARIRLSGYLPSRAVRRAVCGRCEQSFACEQVEEVQELQEVAPPAPPAREAHAAERPKLPPPQAPVWRWLGIPVAAALVVGALLLLQGDEDASPPPAAAPTEAEPGTGAGEGAAPGRARFVSQPGFSMALPPGWESTAPEGGAAFTATASEGTADATLWIERAPDLTFAEFEARSLEQLRSLTGNAEVIERISAPSAAGTVVRLRADTPEGSGVSAPYDVTLRAAGPYRYYLATTVQPGASVQARDGADLIHGSFVPEPDGEGRVQTGSPPGSEEPAP